MLNSLKALVVVLFLATIILAVAKPLALRFMSEEDFRRRRAVWYVITIAAFASPSFWLYAAIAAPVAFWAGRKDSNPAALYLFLLWAAPNASAPIPMVFELSHDKILQLFVVLPALLRRPSETPGMPVPTRQGIQWTDFLLLAFFTLQVIPSIPHDTWTNVVRHEFLIVMENWAVYFMFARTLRDGRSINETLAMLVLTCAIMAPLAAFESARGWLLYVTAAENWGLSESSFAYVDRAGLIRAQAGVGHYLPFGLVMAMGFGATLHLRHFMKSWKEPVAIGVLMWVGLLASYSRAPWIIAVLVMFTYLWLMPQGMRRVAKGALAFGVVAAALAPTSIGQRVLNALPFIGKVDTYNVDYRQRVLEKGLELIPLNPWFGDIFVERKMQELRQGQGIVDILNGFLNVALHAGLVTAGLLVLFLLIVIGRTWWAGRKALRPDDSTVSSLGFILVACILGMILDIWLGGFADVVWILTGVAVAYANWIARERALLAEAETTPRRQRTPAVTAPPRRFAG
jgi:hypothetical protein